MKLLSGTQKKVFSLLSIGQRGVGKTVFLAGSYAELHFARKKDNPRRLWFDCRDSQAQANIEGILSYVARTGQYPPATMRITNFNFSLKHQSLAGVQTLCHFRWWDLPGEYCNLNHPDFQKMVLASNGCCVFINADALVHKPTYLQSFENTVKQVVALASLVNQHHLNYPLALIFTQCDRLKPNPLSRLQIEENLQPLMSRLNEVNAKYQKFYCSVPIVSKGEISTLRPTDAAAPLLWLVSELKKTHNLLSRQDLGSELLKQNSSPNTGWSLPKIPRGDVPRLALIFVGLLGVSASLLFAFNLFAQGPQSVSERQIREYKQVLQRDPDNFDALVNLANLYLDLDQPDKAVPVMEKIVQQAPENLEWRFTLAKLYELTGQDQKAEATYDQILAQQEDNLRALLNKAVLRVEQGDPNTASTLFDQAVEAAPTEELKSKIRNIAQDTLPSAQ